MSKLSRRRKNISALRLSSDTTFTLPEYIPSQDNDQEEDKPPDYPDSAEEADEDTDDSDNSPQAPLSPSRRPKKLLPTLTHRRGLSSQSHLLRPLHHKPRQASERLTVPPSSDPYLDSLLERSVHALEMSNTLLQSSISTQTSLSVILADGSGSSRQSTLEAHAININSRIRDDWDTRAAWADDLEEITRDVEDLYGAESSTTEAGSVITTEGVFIGTRQHRREDSGMSCSLPTSTSAPIKFSRRRPSLDLREAALDTVITPGLHFARQSRENLISPPPRPITQFVPSTQLSDEIALPSTIGVRSQPPVHRTHDQWKSVPELASSSTTSLLAIPSLSSSLPPKLTDKPLEPSTPAYNMLSSFVNRQPTSSGTTTPSTSFTSSFMASIRRPTTTSSERDNRCNSIAVGKKRSSSPPPSPISKHRGASQYDALSHRPMTPPAEESSSSSSDSCVAKRTVQSLRKILDEQPQPVFRTTSLGLSDKLKPPKFMPRTPAPLPEAGTSNATASISRLFTKGTHSSSTRAPSPPRQSAMKRLRSNNSSAPPTPNSATHLPLPVSPAFQFQSLSPTSTTLSIPDMVSKVLSGRVTTSASSSGTSTPSKRISFAELPESYASTRPGGASSSRFKEKNNRSKRRKGSPSSSAAPSKGGISDGEPSLRWWSGDAAGMARSRIGGLGTMGLARHEEMMEDRMTRSWAGRMGFGFGSSGLDEWAA